MRRPALPTAALAALAALGACGPSASPAAAPAPPLPAPFAVPAPPPASVAAPIAVPAPPPACTEPAARSPLAPDRARGVDALLAGRPADAVATFSDVIRRRPPDLAAAALRKGALGALDAASARAGDAAESEPVVRLAPLPLDARVDAPLQVPDGAPSVTLALESQKKNLVTDEADWLAKNALT